MNVQAGIRRTPLRRDDHGPLVRTWQQLLNAKGFVLPVDGDFGAKTLHATLVAQRWARVGADGVVGPKTWAAVTAKKRTRRPVKTVRHVLGLPGKVIDARHGRAGFPHHPTRQWEQRLSGAIVAKLGHYTGGPASFLADAGFHVHSDYLSKGGAPAIAYHLGIDKDGTLYVFNDWHDVTWHCDGGHNTDTLGIVFRGAAEGPTLAQRRTLARVWAQLEAGNFKPISGEPAWPRLVRSTTHQHVNATSCPGEKGEAFYRSISQNFATSI